MSVTTPKGFVASGVTAGLKPSGKPDVAVVLNQGPSNASAAVFTTNRVFAAPVKWSRVAAADGQLQAVVLNSGGANACTGADGYADSALGIADEVSAFAGLRLFSDHHYWSATAAGAGPYVALTYRNLGGEPFYGVALGAQLWGGN